MPALHTALGCGLLLASLGAQTRAPCRGTVRSEDGAPLANAKLVCAAAPDFPAFGAPDRCEVVTDAEGRFAVDLVVGSAYAVWAMGPAEANGRRPVVWPSFRAAAGVQLDLVADTASLPHSLTVHGTADWLAVGPLSLRLYLADGIPLGADVPVPGDGPIPLPPLSTDCLTAGLVDGKGQLLVAQTIDLAAERTFRLPRAYEFEAIAVDEGDQPLAGVEFVRFVHAAFPPALHPLHPAGLSRRPATVVAVTGADGRAQVRLPHPASEEPALLLGTKTGRSAALSGWIDRARIHNGRGAGQHDDEPLRFTMRAAEGSRVRIAGATTVDRLGAQLCDVLPFSTHSHNSGSMVWLDLAFEAEANSFAAARAELGQATGAAILGGRDQAVPHRTLGLVRRVARQVEPFSLDALRTIAVQIVDPAGHPAPGAILGLADEDPRHPLLWLLRLTANAEGRAELRVPNNDFMVYAVTERACGVALVPTGNAAPVRIELQPLATLRLAALDRGGAGASGARLEPGYTLALLTGTPEQQALARIAVSPTGGTHLRALRTDRRGEATARFLPTSSQVQVRVLLGGHRSAFFPLVPRDEALSVRID